MSLMIKLSATCKYNTVYQSINQSISDFLMSPAVSLFPLSACRRKEPGSIGGFKPLVRRLSQRASNQIAEWKWKHDSLKLWQAKEKIHNQRQTRSDYSHIARLSHKIQERVWWHLHIELKEFLGAIIDHKWVTIWKSGFSVTSMTSLSIQGSIWKNLQPPSVFLHDAKNHRYWIAVRHYACNRSSSNSKLTFFQKVFVFSDGKQSFESCLIV